MANSDILSVLQTRNISPMDFNFMMLQAPPLNCLLHPQDGWDIYELAHSLKLYSKLDYKLKCIDQILRARGFTKMLAGTNRVIYRYLEDTSFLLKVSIDRTALSDNFGEMENQWKLAPFVPRMFEVHPSGSIGLQERVEPIRRMSEFIELADDIFDLITNNFIGKYVLEDIGSKFFMNYGIRKGFGPVLLDYPYCYELDGDKLYCHNKDMNTGVVCNGIIDYDDGFNFLICPICGKRYTAKELAGAIKNKTIIVEGAKRMKVQLVDTDGKVIIDPNLSSETIEPPIRKKVKKHNKEISPVLCFGDEEVKKEKIIYPPDTSIHDGALDQKAKDLLTEVRAKGFGKQKPYFIEENHDPNYSNVEVHDIHEELSHSVKKKSTFESLWEGTLR